MNPSPSPLRRPTMADIARAAGVDKSTVSLALRNQPVIPPATRERIRRFADQLGYRPDPLLAAFNSRVALGRNHSHHVLAFVSDLPSHAALHRSERHCEILAGARAQAEHTGRRVELFLTGPSQLSSKRLGQILRTRGITGIILAAFNPAMTALALNWSEFCGVAIESMHLVPRLDQIATNYREAARFTVKKLRDAGHRRIGFAVDSGLGPAIEDQLRAGYLVEHFGRSPTSPLPFCRIEPGSDRTLATWVKQHRPDALVCCGLPAPKDVRMKTIAGICLPDASNLPGIPAVHRALGQRAVEMLTIRQQANLAGLPTHFSTTLLPVAWRE